MFSILYVDDEPDLLEIGKMFLESEGRFSVETVTSAARALDRLGSTSFDAIVSDYQMPVIDGIEFLKRVRSSGNTVPFIIFTGRGREEIVIQALNEGADFYLQKGGDPLPQFAELGHKLQMAIQQRRTEARARDHERREADIINFLPDATLAIDTQGIVIAWNRAMEKMTGVKAADIVGKGDYEYALPFYHERRPILIDLVLRKDPDTSARYPYIKRHGRTLFSENHIPHFNDGRGATLWFTATPLYDRQGEIVGAIESIREVTGWQKAKSDLMKAEDKYRAVFETTGTATTVIENDATISLANSEFVRLSGYKREEIENRMKWTEFVVEDDRERMLAQHRIRRQNPSEALSHYEFRFRTRSGDIRDIYLTVDVIPGTTQSVASLLDITERRKAEELCHHIVEDQTEFICRYAPDGTYIFVNEAFCRCFGMNREDLIGKKFRPIIPAEDLEILRAHYAALTPAQPVKTIVHRVIMPDGKTSWQRWSDRAFFDPSGTLTEYQSVGRDVTEMKETELSLISVNKKLAASEEALRQGSEELDTRNHVFTTLLDTVPIGIFMVEAPSGKPIIANREATRLLGRGILPDATEQNLACVYEAYRAGTTERYPTAEMPIVRGMHGESSHIDDMEIARPDGTRVRVEIFGNPVKDSQGQILASLVSFIDITERKQVEDALQTVQEKFSKAFMSVPDAITISELESGRFIEVNDAATEFFGYSREELIGRTSLELGIWKTKEKRDALIREVKKHGRVTEYEVQERKRSGEPVHVVINADTLAIGNEKYLIMVIHDITGRKMAEQVIREANKKINLLTSITRHDVANQVSLLKGYTRIAMMDNPGPELKGYLDKIDTAGATIARQIEFTRLYQGLGLQAPTWFRISDLVTNLKPDGISVTCTCDAEIFADPMLERVFFNLFENAQSHGERVRTILITCRKDGNGSFYVIVEDDGIGVAAGLKEKIFEKGFGRHTGFGLFLAREILAITGITIAETGEPGKGARFEMTVPEGSWRPGRNGD